MNILFLHRGNLLTGNGAKGVVATLSHLAFMTLVCKGNLAPLGYKIRELMRWNLYIDIAVCVYTHAHTYIFLSFLCCHPAHR